MKRVSRIVLLACAVSFLAGTLPIWADDQPVESLAILARARKLEDLRADSGTPFLLQAQIKAAFGKREFTGEYKLIWWAQNRWREGLVLGDFRRTRDGVSGGYRQVRTWDYQPQVIFDFDKILDVTSILQIGPRETVRKARTRKIAGIALSCVEIDLRNGTARELCFDPATGLLVHAELQLSLMPGADRPTVDYSGAIALSDKRFPSKVRIQRGRGFSMEVSISSLEPASGNPDPALVADPEHSEFWRDCRDSVPADLVDRVQPRFPEDSKRRREQGIVSFYARIEPDGTISHLTTLQSPSPSLERAAREAVEHWRYKPRSCQGTPVKDETIVDVSFWYQQ